MSLMHRMFGLIAILCASTVFADVDIIPLGATWKYLDDGSNQGTAWRDVAFDDSLWSDGPAQLGYGDGDEATVVSFGPSSSNKYRTTYFRHMFNVVNPATLPVLLDLHIVRDDGAVVYVNGTEVFRTNMPGGTINYLTFASSTVGGSDESALFSSLVLTSLLNPGDNVIAVEIHQRTATSSDISFDLQLVAGDGLADLARGPYIQMGSPTGATLRWRTNARTDSRVVYGTSPANLVNVIDDATLKTEHIIDISGLSSDTRYYYAIEDSAHRIAGGDADHFFRTSPPVGTRKPVRIWAIGDSGTANADAEDVYNAYLSYSAGEETDVWLMLGDNAYNDGTDTQYQAAVFDLYPELLARTFLWATLGNHDGHTANSNAQTGPYYDIFSFPRNGELGGVASGTEAYYSFDYGTIHFVCLDSYETARGVNDPMLTWLVGDLAATTQEWIIAFWHHPPYSKGSHNSDTESNLIQMRQNALPILEAAGVDLVLSGHSHSYERSFLIDGHYGVSTTLAPAMIIDGGDGSVSGDGAYQKPTYGLSANEGAVYITAGSSGKISGGALNHPVMVHASLNVLGSVVIDVAANRLDAIFLDNLGATRDAFSIIKDPTFCVADWNGNGLLQTDDFVAYLNDYNAVSGGGSFTYANPDLAQPYGVLNTADFIAFLNAFVGGC